jgi:signal transduction histidine kinase
MQQLIEDLLTYARVTSRAQPFKPVALGSTAASVLEDLETSIGESHGQVIVGALPTVDADASQMRQLFQNLIGNGLKFHPPERAPIVTLSATAAAVAAPDGASRAGWLIDVADNGIGFEPRLADRIFAPFERLHSRAEFPGTGIGLAICRKIAERHGGTITVSSTPGTGTTFHVLLPTAQAAVVDPVQPAASVAIAVAPKPHVALPVAAAVPA